MPPPRILLCGDVLGRLNQLFKRVQTVNKSAGPFDALLCVGQFFPDESDRLEELAGYIEGRSAIPLPTYFIGDYGVGAAKFLSVTAKDSANLGFKSDGLKVCENLYWLRGSGKFNLHGLSIAYLSGRKSSSGQPFGTYSEDDVDSLRALAEEPGIVDLFLTNEWPSGVTHGASAVDVPDGALDLSGGDSVVSELVAEIAPRYHIAGSKSLFYAREPYCNVDAVHVTRFLGLASVGNKDKQKFIHAIAPTPASSMSASELSMKPPNSTLSPYAVEQPTQSKEVTKRSGDNLSDSQYWRYDVTQKRHKSGGAVGEKICFKFVCSGSCPREEKCHFRHDTDAREQCLRGVCLDFIIKGRCEKGPECSYKHEFQDGDQGNFPKKHLSGNASTNRSKECWFCLSSPNVESHLVVSLGENFYCALAKGPLVQDHVLLIPIEHLPNTISIVQECESELVRFCDSLRLYCKNLGKQAVFFEWASKRATHANLQVIPIPSSRSGVVGNVFNMAADKLGFKFVARKFDDPLNGRKWLRTEFNSSKSYFYAELPDGTFLLHSVDENETFPAQFGREVIAGLLNMADKADWRNCKVSQEEESRMVDEFKKLYGELDPNN